MRSRHWPRNQANYSQPDTANRFPQPPTAFNDLWLPLDRLKLRQWTWKPGKDTLQRVGGGEQWVVLFPAAGQQDTLWKPAASGPLRCPTFFSVVVWEERDGKNQSRAARLPQQQHGSAGTWISVGLISGHRVKRRKCHGCSLQPDHQQVSEIHSELVYGVETQVWKQQVCQMQWNRYFQD